MLRVHMSASFSRAFHKCTLGQGHIKQPIMLAFSDTLPDPCAQNCLEASASKQTTGLNPGDVFAECVFLLLPCGEQVWRTGA